MAYLTSGRNKIMGSSVSTDANVVTVIDESSTDEQVPSALATKAYVDSKDSYSKDEVDTLLVDKANTSDTYNKTEIDALLDGKANTDDVTTNGYTKEEVDDLLANKADSSAIVDAYTKGEVDTLLTAKADATALDNYVLSDELDDYALTSSVYNKTEIDDLLTDKVNTTSVVTTLSSTNVDAEIPSAKAVYDAIQNVSAGVPADVYSKTEVDDLLAHKADSTDIIDAYTKEEVDNLLNAKVDTDDVVDAYSKEEVNNLLDGKADSTDIVDAYTKTEVDTLLTGKADTSAIIDAYNKTEVDDLLANKADTSAIIDAYTKDETNDLLDTKVNVVDLVDSYSKTEVDNLLADKVNTDDLVDAYSKIEVDGLLNTKVDTSDVVTALSSSSTDEEIPSAKTVFDAIQNVSAGVPADVYSKTEVDTLLADKANTDAIIDAYTKTEVNNLLSSKANTADLIDAYSKSEVDALLDDKEVKISTEENNKIEIKDDGIFVSKDYVEITQAEYDLLTEEEKVDIVFYIKDATGNTELVTVINENSTDEQVPTAKAVHTAIQNVTGGVPADVYSKTEVNNLLADKADTDDLVDAYTKTEVDGLLGNKANVNDVYSKTDVDDLLADKADSADIIDAYSKEEVNNLLNTKADSSAIVDSYTKTEVDGLLADKADSTDIVDAYTKTEVNTLLNGKANTSDIIDAYNKTEVDTLLADKANVDDIVDSYTKTETDGLLATKANATALDDYVTNNNLTSTLSNYPTNSSLAITLSDYATYSDLNSYATKTSVTTNTANIATNTANIATNTARIDNLYNPNILINGAFQVNDYNVTSVPSSNTSVVYLTNRWATNSKGLSCSVSSSEHYLRVQASSGCTGLSVFQMIENRDITYEGTTLTLSFYIRGVGTGVGKTVTGRIGSGGGNTGETRVTLTDSWQYVTSTRTGVYFGSKSDGGVVIYSQDITDVGAGFDISGVKLELGSVATLFAQRSDVEELELCQRYYQKWTGISHTDVPLGNFSVGTGDICSILYLPTPMRTTPSIKSTLTDVELYGCNTAWAAYEAHEPTHLSVYSMSNNTLTLRCRSNGTFAVGSSGIFRIKFGYQYNFILDAELYS